jgi:predicted TIM-barrel fold metal-dependent hydrolase
LARRDLVFDAFVLHPQLPEVASLARAFPDTRIVLDHTGTPMVVGRYQGGRGESFTDWKRGMTEVATCANVSVKLGGLNMGLAGIDALERDRPFTSQEMAAAQRDYILTTIDLFGPRRCMFESNFPIDMRGISYDVLWNGFKRIAQSFTADEKAQLFSGTSRRVYRA